jgi:hypothetical protein
VSWCDQVNPLDRAKEKRQLQARLNNDADTSEQNIAKEKLAPEYLKLEGQEKYEADREKNEAWKIITDYRTQAKALDSEIGNPESTAKVLQRQIAGRYGRPVTKTSMLDAA